MKCDLAYLTAVCSSEATAMTPHLTTESYLNQVSLLLNFKILRLEQAGNLLDI